MLRQVVPAPNEFNDAVTVTKLPPSTDNTAGETALKQLLVFLSYHSIFSQGY